MSDFTRSQRRETNAGIKCSGARVTVWLFLLQDPKQVSVFNEEQTETCIKCVSAGLEVLCDDAEQAPDAADDVKWWILFYS